MIQLNLSTSNTIPTISFAISASRSGKASFPVAPAIYIYSQFKHVSGVPAPEGTRGVTINKLKILDVLIEQLNQIKKRPEPLSAERRLSAEQVDAMIEQLETQIRQASAANIIMPYNPAPQAPMGMIFDLVA